MSLSLKAMAPTCGMWFCYIAAYRSKTVLLLRSQSTFNGLPLLLLSILLTLLPWLRLLLLSQHSLLEVVLSSLHNDLSFVPSLVLLSQLLYALCCHTCHNDVCT